MSRKQKFLLIVLWIAALLAFFFMSPNKEEINNLFEMTIGVI
ncbi:MAG: hypothetical protein ACOCRO_05270 [Halanaerobiales bacterium]